MTRGMDFENQTTETVTWICQVRTTRNREIPGMRTTIKALHDFTVRASDAELGRVKDVCFDDVSWQARFLVIDVQHWLPGRKVLLSPCAISLFDPTHRLLCFNVSRKQIEESPHIDEHAPLSRPQEAAINSFFGWNQYWMRAYTASRRIPTANYGSVVEKDALPEPLRTAIANREMLASNLTCFRNLQGYDVIPRAMRDRPRRLGSLSDLVVNYVEWTVPYFIVDTGHILSGKKIVVPTAVVLDIESDLREIKTFVRPEVAQEIPAFDGVERLDENNERAMLGHYINRFRIDYETEQYEPRARVRVHHALEHRPSI